MLEEFRKSASENAERITYLAERIEELDSILQCLRGQHVSCKIFCVIGLVVVFHKQSSYQH